MEPIQIEGARVVLPEGVRAVSVRVEDGRIAALDGPRDGARRVNAASRLLAPALVDIHGDAFERQIMPRPGVFVSPEVALFETDRQLVGNGIATAFHAVTLGWEPGLRSVERGGAMIRGLAGLAPRLAAENRVQLRWETFCFDALPLITEALQGALTPSVAFNDHTSMAMLHPDVPMQDRPFELADGFPVIDTDTPAAVDEIAQRAARSGLTPRAYFDLLLETWARRPEVPGRIATVAAAARQAGASMLSHDDSQPETRAFYRDHGARIAEFPMNDRTALAAREAGDWIVFGAPNAMRGGSHLGSQSAADMVRRGLCDILASDYYYPAMLGAVARMLADGLAPLHDLWPLVSANPARASGLTDRGEIAVGRRADLVLLDWPKGGTPRVVTTLRGGLVAHDAGGLGQLADIPSARRDIPPYGQE